MTATLAVALLALLVALFAIATLVAVYARVRGLEAGAAAWCTTPPAGTCARIDLPDPPDLLRRPLAPGLRAAPALLGLVRPRALPRAVGVLAAAAAARRSAR